MHRLVCWLSLLGLSASTLLAAQKAPMRKTENVFLIISDGLRWQEIFRGAEDALMTKTNGGVKNIPVLRTNFWRNTPESRRTALMPFVWGEVARLGQLYGNQSKGSVASVTNGKKFSYPGYNEMLTGLADPKVDSNDKKPNPNVTVFEWLQRQPKFRDRVVAFATWDAFPYIFNQQRSGVPVWPPWESKFETKSIAAPAILQDLLRDTTPVFEGVILDSFLLPPLVEHLQKRRPRAIFVGFGETDEWAHAGRYDLYLEAIHRLDDNVRRLWETVQRLPQYRGKTTFILSTDHGRGSGLEDWKDHGEKTADSEGIWLGVIGPDTPPLGERAQTAAITQAQIAATVAAFLGEDFQAAFHKAAPAIADLFSTPWRGEEK
ncbi:MAG: alkaline phosphatase family protein [Verrucomicrobiota bacterium]